MPSSYPLHTERLDLIPATLEILDSDLHHNHAALGRLLDAGIPSAWPPPLLDQDALAQFIAMLSEGTDPHFCSWYWVRTGPDGADRTLIGSGGAGSSSASQDEVMIGYSVLDQFQNCGYATEAVRCLVSVLFAEPDVRRIVASTYPELKPSIRVLEKCGFVPAGEISGGTGLEEGTVMLVLERPQG